MFIDGYLALATAITTTGAVAPSATELTGVAANSRAPISFGEPTNGVCFSANAYTFGMATRWMNNGQAVYPTPAGRIIFDHPTAAIPLLILPFATPFAAGRIPWDRRRHRASQAGVLCHGVLSPRRELHGHDV